MNPGLKLATFAAIAAVLCCGCFNTEDEQRYGDNNCGTDGTDASCKTVKIGNLTWMAENLNYAPSGGNSWCYNDMEYNCKKFGRLYDWNTANAVCPAGWRLPDTSEWNTLVNAAGGDSVAGKKLKSKYGWYNNGNGTDYYGFSALPGGWYTGGGFNLADYQGYWWTVDELDGENAYSRDMGNSYDYVGGRADSKGYGYSVRCVKDGAPV